MKKENIEIVQKEEAVLRKIANEVSLKEISSAKIQKIIADMKIALVEQEDGVAIAAPQIGIPLRIFVVSKRAEIIMKGMEDFPQNEKDKLNDSVYINPEIKKVSKLKAKLEEGCLSVRYLYGKVMRAEKVLIVAYDENGNKFTKGGSGLLAQIFQHEIDHLNGILFIDKADDLVEILPEKNDKQI
jgi:peptide deformylase